MRNLKLPTVRAYLSNIVRIWPLDQQEAMHTKGTPGWPDKVAIYRDELRPAARRAHSPEAMKERAEALRSTGRRRSDEELYVASLAVLAWTAEDFMQCLAAAKARHASVVVLSTGTRIAPDAGADVLAKAQSEFLAERRRAQTGEGRRVGARISADRKKADTLRRIQLIRADWPLRTVSTAELLLRAGRVPKGKRDVVKMAYTTAVEHLGHRPDRQVAHERAVKRETARKEKVNVRRKRKP